MRFKIMSGIVAHRAHWFTCGQTSRRRPRPLSLECRLEMPCKKRSANPISDLLKKLNLPTRENYLAIDRWEPNPKLGPEEEAELPPQFRAKETSGDRNRLRN